MILLREAARVAREAVVIKDHTKNGLAADATLRFMDRIGNPPLQCTFAAQLLVETEMAEITADDSAQSPKQVRPKYCKVGSRSPSVALQIDAKVRFQTARTSHLRKREGTYKIRHVAVGNPARAQLSKT
jgi:hypothetical protein